MQNALFQALSSSYLSLLESVSPNGGRESFRALAKLAHELKNASPSTIPSTETRAKEVWIVHATPEASPYPRILSAGDFTLTCFTDELSVKNRLGQKAPDLVIIATSFPSLISLIHDQYPDVKIILSGAGDIAASIAFLQSRPHLNHMVFDHAFDSIFMQRGLLTNCQKILTGDIFGIEKYLDHGAFITDIVISGNSSRHQALDQLNKDLTGTGLSTTLTRKAHHLTDELLMNAIYDAPYDHRASAPRYNHLTRAVNVELEPKEYARFRYGFDGTVLALSIDDPFGGLPRDIILKYLKSCFEGEFGKLNEKEGKGGGGMGLYQILSSADLFVANIVPGARTEVIVLINIYERLPLQTHAFHYFQLEPKQQFAPTPVQTHLSSIVGHLQDLCEAQDPKAIQLIHNNVQQLKKIIPQPKSVKDIDHVLLISANKRHQRALRGVLGTGMLKLEFRDAVADLPKDYSPALIAVDDTICDAATDLRKAYPAAKIIALSDRTPAASCDDLKKYPDLTQIMSMDLPKNILHKLLLTHITQLLNTHKLDIKSYLSFGSAVKVLDDSTSLAELGEDHQALAAVARTFAAKGSVNYALDSHVCALGISWQEKLDRNQIIERFGPSSNDASVKAFYAHAHAIIVQSNGLHNELILLRFQSLEEVPEPFLYTFIP